MGSPPTLDVARMVRIVCSLSSASGDTTHPLKQRPITSAANTESFRRRPVAPIRLSENSDNPMPEIYMSPKYVFATIIEGKIVSTEVPLLFNIAGVNEHLYPKGNPASHDKSTCPVKTEYESITTNSEPAISGKPVLNLGATTNEKPGPALDHCSSICGDTLGANVEFPSKLALKL